MDQFNKCGVNEGVDGMVGSFNEVVPLWIVRLDMDKGKCWKLSQRMLVNSSPQPNRMQRVEGIKVENNVVNQSVGYGN